MSDLTKQLEAQRAALAEEQRRRDREAQADQAEIDKIRARANERDAVAADVDKEIALLDRKVAVLKEAAELGLPIGAAAETPPPPPPPPPAEDPPAETEEEKEPPIFCRKIQHYPFSVKLEAAIFMLAGCAWANMDKNKREYLICPREQMEHIVQLENVTHVMISPFFKKLHLSYLWGIYMLTLFSRLPEVLRLVQCDGQSWILTERGLGLITKQSIPHIQAVVATYQGIYTTDPEHDAGHYLYKKQTMEAARALPTSVTGIMRAHKNFGVPMRPGTFIKDVPPAPPQCARIV